MMNAQVLQNFCSSRICHLQELSTAFESHACEDIVMHLQYFNIPDSR